jgi:adenosylhomocysteine nucleosidase
MKTPILMQFVILAQLMCVSFLAPASSGQTEFGPRTFNVENRWTAIVSAYNPEITAINSVFATLDDVKIDRVMSIKGVKYQLGSYKGEPIVIFTTGISIPNAAMTMQMALDYFPIDKVIMMGIAGAVNPSFEPGDIAIPERWYFHDESVYVNPDPEKPGEYILPSYYEDALARYQARAETDPHAPKYTNFGMIHPEEMSIVKAGWDSPRQVPYFTATPKLVELTETALSTIEPITMPSGKIITVSIGGNGVTGSVFADNGAYRLWLRDVYSAEVTEMESAAIAQVCFVNNVDWIIIRSVSDLAGGQPGKNAENVFDAIASGTGTKLMMGLLDQLVLTEATQ